MPARWSTSTSNRCRAVVELDDALLDKTLVHPDLGTNTYATFASEHQADFSECEVVLDLRVVNQRINGSPIEPRSGLAYWEPDPGGDRLVHYSACQGAHPTRDILAKIYDLPDRSCSRCRARRRRRVRREVTHDRRGVDARLAVEAGRQTGSLHRDPYRGDAGDAAGPRSTHRREDRRHTRWTRHRVSTRRRARRRRISADGRLPADDDPAHGPRRLRHSQLWVPRSVGGHQQDVGHRVPRRRSSRSGAGDRAGHRLLRRRDRHGSGGGPPAQLHPEVHGAVHHRNRHRLRRRRLRGGHAPRARRSRLSGAARRAGRAASRWINRADRYRSRRVRRDHLGGSADRIRRGASAARTVGCAC